MSAARLSVVGTGIRAGGQLTLETRHLIEQADRVLAVVDGLALVALQQLNPNVESLQDCYQAGSREAGYAEMVRRILAALDQGGEVCAAFYGHPGVFVWPAHEALRQARARGLEARMYPGISAEDCLFADLEIDPALHGCQSYEAMDFYLYPRTIDPTACLILWQMAALGDVQRKCFEPDRAWLLALSEVLTADFPKDHQAVIYEAAAFPLAEPRREPIALGQLDQGSYTQVSTLFIPPLRAPVLCPQRLARVGLDTKALSPAASRRYRQARR
ncbi:MAG: SAM-dependent methyltransferase [Wenzhouxiangella sp.]